jgi:pimeloyl-ACP methyl ester carboxylesterase
MPPESAPRARCAGTRCRAAALPLAALAAGVLAALSTVRADGTAPLPHQGTLTLSQLRAHYGDQTGRIADIDGIGVYYKDEGRGPAILLVHGSAGSLTTFDEVVALLRRHYRTIRYDVPGQGLSDDVSDAAAKLEPADIAAKLLLRLGIHKVTAVGNSSGGSLCVYLAAKYPDYVERLVLANTPADPVDTSKMRQPQDFIDAQREARETHFQSERFWELFLTYFAGDPSRVTPRIRQEFYDFNRRVPHANALALVAKVADHARAVDALGRVKAPTLLVWGARDPLLTPASADVLAGYLTQASVSKLMLPDVGHYPPIEVPVRFAAIVAAYIEAVTPVEPNAPLP